MNERGDFVLDASVTLAWCFEDEASPFADTAWCGAGYKDTFL